MHTDKASSAGKTAPIHEDGCPQWAEEMIAYLYKIEVKLGNIPQTSGWQSNHLKLLAESSLVGHVEEAHADEVFRNVVRRLSDQGQSSGDIAAMINRRVGYDKGPQYCNSQEVEEALASL